MKHEILKTVLESLIFVSEEPISFKYLADLTGINSREELKAALADIEQDCIAQKRGVVLYEVAGGYQFRTPSESAKYVAKLFEGRPQKLTRAALETMAIIAYRQPIVRAEIEKIRGVDTGGVIKTLLDRELIRIVSRQDTPGRPALYGTTSKFLEFFGLKSLSDMPDLKEMKELGDASEEQIADEAPGREPPDGNEDHPPEEPSEEESDSDE
jgi:segregation and condensation protein B